MSADRVWISNLPSVSMSLSSNAFLSAGSDKDWKGPMFDQKNGDRQRLLEEM
jgi:hypothetical protein